MTCKDCLGNIFCSKKDKTKRVDKYCADADEICDHFKDKSRFIELPCKVGDEAYLISEKRYSPVSYKLVKAKVIGFKINRSGIYNVELKTLELDFTFTRHIGEVYFDKSEAEAKLKELEK